MIRPLAGGGHAVSRLQGQATAMPWETGHTPQIRWVMCAASRGSRLVQDRLEAAEQGAGGLGIDDLLDAVDRVDGHLDLQVPFDPGDRVDKCLVTAMMSSLFRRIRPA